MTTPRLHDGIRLVATRSAISCARLFVEYTLGRWGAGVIVDDAVREIAELATNAVKATGTMDKPVRWTEVTHIELITVRLLGFETSIRIEVWDSAPNLPALPEDPDVAIKRGCYPAAHGKVVWTELSVLPLCTKLEKASSFVQGECPADELERTQPDLDLIRGVGDGMESF